MRQIRWATEASDQLVATVRHIGEDNPTAARSMARAIVDNLQRLAEFPGLGRPGEVNGARELVCPPYVLVYRYTDEIVEILHVWHGAQDWR